MANHKEARSKRKSGGYEKQRGRTENNKRNARLRAARRLQKWIKLGKKKNGKLVLNEEQRVIRKSHRKQLRTEAANVPRPAHHRSNRYRGNNNTRRPRTPGGAEEAEN